MNSSRNYTPMLVAALTTLSSGFVILTPEQYRRRSNRVKLINGPPTPKTDEARAALLASSEPLYECELVEPVQFKANESLLFSNPEQAGPTVDYEGGGGNAASRAADVISDAEATAERIIAEAQAEAKLIIDEAQAGADDKKNPAAKK